MIVPFGVPSDGHGLGLGLAALLHSFAQLDGESVALAQLFSHPSPGAQNAVQRSSGSTTGRTPVEAFVPPTAWKDLVGHGNVPAEIHSVVTGAFEPPTDGKGLLQILVFDGRDGRARARIEAHVDPARAGETVLDAFSEVWSALDGDLGAVRDIRDLNWDALESVLRAERCALHDPHRGGPHDRLAAMLHLGRAIFDAPASRFPADDVKFNVIYVRDASQPEQSERFLTLLRSKGIPVAEISELAVAHVMALRNKVHCRCLVHEISES